MFYSIGIRERHSRMSQTGFELAKTLNLVKHTERLCMFLRKNLKCRNVRFYLCEIFFCSCLFCFVAITVLREEGMETVCLHFGSTLPRCLEAAAKGKTTSTAQGKPSLYTICRHFIFHHVVFYSHCVDSGSLMVKTVLRIKLLPLMPLPLFTFLFFIMSIFSIVLNVYLFIFYKYYFPSNIIL